MTPMTAWKWLVPIALACSLAPHGRALAQPDDVAEFSFRKLDAVAADAYSRSPRGGDVIVPGRDGKAYWVRPEVIVIEQTITNVYGGTDWQGQVSVSPLRSSQ